ncbi:MAG: geranylgeranylglyceryl/heptaprenylglyceryl phosphate synthase [Ignavibacteria bacterium]|nr:geranylgeranylglyceryl/heptaprenylglyceryl phosphate synthase [Ignavibacteria bacterium]
MSTWQRLLKIRQDRGAGYFILIDPDKVEGGNLADFVRSATEASVDGFLVGGSLILSDGFDERIREIKQNTSLPVMIFPGSLFQISSSADAILFLVLISGRNPDHLIGNQVVAAPIIKKMQLEAISTGYMLIGTGKMTSAEFMSNTKPIPAHKPDIAVAHAIAAETIGMKLLYLDAGSGADGTIPETMIAAIARHCSLPIAIGGGIRTPEEAARKVAAGASFIVTGTIHEEQAHRELMREIVDAVHKQSHVRS